MTNCIGTGTCNLSVNVPTDERRQLVKLAGALSQSLGDLIRRVALKGLETELAELETRLNRQIGSMEKDGETILIRRTEAFRQTVRGIRNTREKYYGAITL